MLSVGASVSGSSSLVLSGGSITARSSVGESVAVSTASAATLNVLSEDTLEQASLSPE
jgi:hypothetical protein